MDVANFIQVLSDKALTDGFGYGVGFVLIVMLFGFIVDMPQALIRVWSEIRIKRECYARHSFPVLSVSEYGLYCHVKRCPCSDCCPYYMERVSFWKRLKFKVLTGRVMTSVEWEDKKKKP